RSTRAPRIMSPAMPANGSKMSAFTRPCAGPVSGGAEGTGGALTGQTARAGGREAGIALSRAAPRPSGRRLRVQVPVDLVREAPREARDLGDLLGRRRAQRAHAAEMPQQRRLSRRADTG